MLLKEINDLVMVDIPSVDPNDANNRLLSTKYVNFAIDELWRAANWEFRKKSGSLLIIPNYSTGTASILLYSGTNETAARTVTLSAPLTFDAQGFYFRPKDGSSEYRIISGDVGSVELFLESPVIDPTNIAVEFEIWKRFYYLKSEVDVLLDIRRCDNGESMNYVGSSKASSRSSFIENYGTTGNFYSSGSDFSVYGVDPYDDVSHETGTITIPENSNVATGVGTNFIGNVDSGDVLIVGSYAYFIKRVESDTSLILSNYAVSPVASGSSYKINKMNPIGLVFYNPTQSYQIVNYQYLSKSTPLINEQYDDFKFEYDYIEAIVLNAQAMWLKNKDYQKYIQIIGLYQAKLNGLKIKKRTAMPRFRQFEPYINLNMPGRD